VHQNGSLTDPPLEDLEGGLLILSPCPLVVLLEELVEGPRDIGEARNPSVIEINKTDKLADASYHGGVLPLHDVRNLLVVHFETLPTDVHPEELDFRLVEFAFLRIAE